MPRVTLTDRFVASAKSKDAPQTDYFDEVTPGLALRVSEGGRKTWTLLYSAPADGKRTRITLGSYPAKSLARARTLALEAKEHLDEGRDPRDVLAAQDAGAITMAMLCKSYLEKHVRPSMRSAANFEQRLNKNVLGVIGDVRLADLHARNINQVLDPIIARGKPTEANRAYENLRAMLKWAVRRGDLDRSPIDTMSKPAAESAARERVLSDGEIRHLWTILPTALPGSKACQRIVRLCLVTGQRVGEVAGMRADELDLKKQVWSLPGSRTKNANAHTVPLSDLAVTIIKDALADTSAGCEYVFPGAVGSIDAHAVATTLRRAHTATKTRPRGRFDMAPFTAHDLRRTSLTGLAQLGTAPIVIGAVANHLSVTKSSVTFISYVKHNYAEEKAHALSAWAERLTGIIDGGAAQVLPLQKSRVR